jgi:hypothetical protein
MPDGYQIKKSEFDELVKNKQFSDGPYLDTFGDGYGEPYNPNRHAWGKLKNGKEVWAYVRGPLSDEICSTKPPKKPKQKSIRTKAKNSQK